MPASGGGNTGQFLSRSVVHMEIRDSAPYLQQTARLPTNMPIRTKPDPMAPNSGMLRQKDIKQNLFLASEMGKKIFIKARCQKYL